MRARENASTSRPSTTFHSPPSDRTGCDEIALRHPVGAVGDAPDPDSPSGVPSTQS